MADSVLTNLARYFLKYPDETFTITVGALSDINERIETSQSRVVKVTATQAAFIAQYLQLRDAPDVTSE
jgi:hypothetical protein